MEKLNSFRKIAGWLAVISVPFALTNFTLTGIAGSNDVQDLSGLYSYINAGAKAGYFMKWACLADLVGYYLLLVPATFFIHHWLKSKNPYWISIFTFSGLAYIFAGSIGAAILAKTWPTLISGYACAKEPIKEMYNIVFVNSTQMVYGGIWGYFEFLLAGIWWIGIGFTMKSERKALGIVTIILGFISILTCTGEIFNIESIAIGCLFILLLLAPVWACWLGISLIRGKDLQITNP